MELHIFDFDGTLFYSPAPRRVTVEAGFGRDVFNRLSSPLDSNGFGWFQSLSTLCPPAVPEKPDVDRWYVQPTVARLRAVAARGVTEVRCFVLTGRDEKYRARIESLLAHAGLREAVTDVFLKPHETAGTVKYKLSTFLRLIEQYQPARVFYYEDRPEQGGKLFEGINALQKALYGGITDSHLVYLPDTSDASSSSSPSPSADLPPLTFSGLFGDDSKQETAGVRAAHRWVSDTVNALNAQRAPEQKEDREYRAPFQRSRRDNGPINIPAARFAPLPSFSFTMVMVPPHLCARSEAMLTTAEQVTLVERLMEEQRVYAATHKPSSSSGNEEGRGGGQQVYHKNHNNSGRGGWGGGGGGNRGERGGRGAWGGGYSGNQAPQPAKVVKMWMAPSDYPSLPYA